MPVVGNYDRRSCLSRREFAQFGAAEQEDEGDEATDHVQTVKARGQKEDRAESAGRNRDAFIDEIEILIRLAADKDRAHDQGDQVPATQAVHITAFSGENTEL